MTAEIIVRSEMCFAAQSGSMCYLDQKHEQGGILQWSLLQAEADTAAVLLQEFRLGAVSHAPGRWVPMLGRAGRNTALAAPDAENGVREAFLDDLWERRIRGGKSVSVLFILFLL